MEEEKIDNPFQIGEQVDCLDTVNQWLNAEIIAKRGQEVRVHYTQWSQKYDDWIAMQENRILKQWEFGQPIQINNRLDVQYSENKQSVWLEAIVKEIDQEDRNRVFIHFIGYKVKYDQWVDLTNNNQVADVGQHSKAHGRASLQKNNPKYMKSQKNFIEILKKRETDFRNQLQNIHNWTIREVEPDGNCLFRSISHQIYQVEDYYREIRQVCMDYIQINQDYFKNFIIGGGRNFEDYVIWKRTDRVWGDNIEIQAIREIYERPVEIYAYSSTPMRTFSENSVNNQRSPIRLSYHGQSHYNSINTTGDNNQGQQSFTSFSQQQQQGAVNESNDNYDDSSALAQSEDSSYYSQQNSQQQQPVQNVIQFGEFENQALEKAKERAIQKQQQQQQQQQDGNNGNYQDLEQARKDFDKIGNWDMDQAIKESLNLFNEKIQENEQNLMEMALKEDAINQVEQVIQIETDQTIQESRQQYEQEQIRLAYEQSRKEQEEREKNEQVQLQEQLYEEQLKKATMQSNADYNDQINKVILASLNDFNKDTSHLSKSNKYVDFQGNQGFYNDNFSNSNNSQNQYSQQQNIGNINSSKNNNSSSNFILVGDPMENSTVLQVLNNDLGMDISLKEAVQAYEMYGENPQEIIEYFCYKKL